MKRIRRWRERLWLMDGQTYAAFRLGYVTALDDIERTGLRPMTDRTKQDSACRAYDRLLKPEEPR
jgi:hypothetical protein